MRTLLAFLAILVVLGTASLPALAGPNESGVIVVHNTGIEWSTDLPLPPVSPAPACADIVNEIPMGAAPGDISAALVWKVYAAFPPSSSPRLKGCGWGIGLTSDGAGRIVIQGNDAPAPEVFYITTAGWPGDSTYIGMSFTDSARVDTVNELFWFGGYAYAGAAGEPQTFCVIPHSGEANRFFVDDAVPQNVDPIAGYGCLGFGQPGDTPCPPGLVTGACCLPNGDCTMVAEPGCETAGGSFFGGDCAPGLCPPPAIQSACCVDYVCSLETPETCAAHGGTYYGDGTVCTPSPCPPPPPPTGACCDLATGDCSITTEAACPFDWLGADVPCNVETCPPPTHGPNAGGVIVVHNTGIEWSTDLPLPPVSPAPACADIVNEIPMGAAPGDSSAALVWKVYAAFPPSSSPRLKGCGWGIGLTSTGGGGVVIPYNGAPSPQVFFITTDGWPGDNTCIGMAFTDSVRTTHVAELFDFAGYAYAGLGGEPQTFCVIPHSTEMNRVFLDDAIPQNADPIASYGCLGFGQPGFTPCPIGIGTGACCFPATGYCQMLSEADCGTAGGSYLGGDCVPYPCPPPTNRGACCVAYVCSLETPEWCAAHGGTYYGDGSGCSPSPCPPPPTGACCNLATGSCNITTQAACPFDWLGAGVPCSPQTCPPPPEAIGACCEIATGHCSITTQAACSFDWLGVGVPCSVETCPFSGSGSNANGVLVVHNTGVAWSTDLELPPVTPVPASCWHVVNEIPMGSAPGDVSAALVWKVYAVFPPENSPRLKACAWGVGHPSINGGEINIDYSDAPTPAVFFLTTDGWPGDNTYIGMSFTDGARTSTITELFAFAGYAYAGVGGEPQSFCVIPHTDPTNRFFLDDGVPPHAEPIMGYGCLGFGQAGFTPCLVGPAAGACCFPDGSCIMTIQADCQTADGSFVGGDCTPTLCQIIAYGACCFPNGLCDLVAPATCAAQGGTYYGDGTPCTPGLCLPVPVLLAEMSVEQQGYGVELGWVITADASVSQFSVYRTEAREAVPALLAEVQLTEGSRQTYRDNSVAPGQTYYYWIEAIGRGGERERFGPWSISVVGPTESILWGNLPNPMRERTTIRFYLSQGGEVALDFYDAKGRLVRSIDSESLAAGARGIDWDGRDQQGREVAGGVYQYRLRTPGRTLSGKLIVVR